MSSTVVLRKRKHSQVEDPLVLHLSSSPSPSYDPYSESDYDTSKSSFAIPTSSYAPQETLSKKRYKCSHDGCRKAYSKPSRLAEHERSHTGDVRILLHHKSLSMTPLHCSDRSSARLAVKVICASLIYRPIPAHTYQALPDHLNVRRINVGNASGLLSIYASTVSYTKARNHSRYGRNPCVSLFSY